MGNLVVLVCCPSFGLLPHFGNFAEDMPSCAPLRKLPLRRSMKPFFMGRSGSLVSKAMPLRQPNQPRPVR
jgi:hypothetical protein